MIYTDGFTHSLDYFEEPFYIAENVTESNFNSKKSFLYSNQGIKILEGMKKIKFNYYSPSNQLLASDTVLVIREGQHQGENLGVSGTLPIGAKEGDFFTYIGADTDNYSYGDVVEVKDGQLEKVDAGDQKIVESLPSALTDPSLDWEKVTEDNKPIGIFVEKLTANEAFIKVLATEILKLQQPTEGKGGVICSSNYPVENINEDGTFSQFSNVGWAITHAGMADFANINATNGSFQGRLDNTVITCIPQRREQVHWEGYINEAPQWMWAASENIGGEQWWMLACYINNVKRYWRFTVVYDEHKEMGGRNTYDSINGLPYYIYNPDTQPFYIDAVVPIDDPTTSALNIVGIPSTQDEFAWVRKNDIYRDSNGYLKIALEDMMF